MWSDNDNMPPWDYFMPKLGPWRWVWLALVFSVPDYWVNSCSGFSRLREGTLKRRKKLWEKRQETGGASRATSLTDGRKAGPQHQKSFAADTAE